MNTKDYQAEYRKKVTTAKKQAKQSYRQAVAALLSPYKSPDEVQPAELEKIGRRVVQMIFSDPDIDAVQLQYLLSVAFDYVATRRDHPSIEE